MNNDFLFTLCLFIFSLSQLQIYYFYLVYEYFFVTQNQKISKESNGKDFIVKEAENVINEYINKLNEKSSKNKISKLENKIKILRITNIMFFIILIISILISKLI